MILDRENQFSWKQTITVAAPSTDIIDLGPNMWSKESMGAKPLPIYLSVDETFTSAGATVLTVEVQSSNAENFGSGVRSHGSIAIPKADLAVGARLTQALHIPEDAQRYVRLNYTIATGPFTAGKLSAGVTWERQTNG